MRILLSLITAITLVGCGQQSDDAPTGAKKQSPSAAKLAAERMTGKTAVDTYKHTKEVLKDVEKSTKARTQSLDDFKKE